MANLQHLAILQEGIEPWNQWKKSHRDVIADFSEASLECIVLSNADLSGANFTGANLSRAVLQGLFSALPFSEELVSGEPISGARCSIRPI